MLVRMGSGVECIPVPVLHENSIKVVEKTDLALQDHSSAPLFLFEDALRARDEADLCVPRTVRALHRSVPASIACPS